tara:strand:+ start:672 stop:1364 length:693 start_codon:yes stop_codon:yes gene_type:complete
MKIYFDGCSWTKGVELENIEEERYSKLICDQLGAEETNLGYGGGSNDRIVRNLLVENNIEKYDAAFIQMTFPTRTEYLRAAKFVEDRWIKVSPKRSYSEWLYKKSEQEFSLLGDRGLENGASTMPILGDQKFDYWTKADGHAKFWRHYYTSVANRRYFDVKENIQLQTIRNHCKAHDVPLILCTINTWSKLKFDYVMKVREAKKARNGHPNKQGHQMIANDLLKYYENLL